MGSAVSSAEASKLPAIASVLKPRLLAKLFSVPVAGWVVLYCWMVLMEGWGWSEDGWEVGAVFAVVVEPALMLFIMELRA